jgi:hypothetical protein
MTDSGFAVTGNFPITPAVTDPIGSARFLTVQEFAVGGHASTMVDGSGAAILASSVGDSTFGSSAEWHISYGVFAGGLHYDATDGGLANAFKITVDSVGSSPEFVITINAYTGAGTSNGGFFAPLLAGETLVPFSLFTGTIDFADINQIHLVVRDSGLSHNGNASITQFETVPEPATGALAAAALLPALGLLLRRRRPASRPAS